MILLHCRTLYHDCDIYLLDDPFRWLGRQVSDRIFSRCILKLLKDKTIVLVTDKHRHIIKSDRIIALRNVSCGPIKIYLNKTLFYCKITCSKCFSSLFTRYSMCLIILEYISRLIYVRIDTLSFLFRFCRNWPLP